MPKRTPLYDLHRTAGARMVDFGGWEMPLHYGSQVDEHRAVRAHCGMFDVSHMRVVDLAGAGALELLRQLLANDAARLDDGKALYSCMLREDGGVLDDLIVYRRSANAYRLVVNAATGEADIAWMDQERSRLAADCALQPRPDLALVAVQGPEAPLRLAAAVPRLAHPIGSLRAFHALEDADWFVARTGYTGEDGFEIALAQAHVAQLWQALQGAGVAPCGLGARDTLRLEAGMNLYGSDMDETVTPLESGLAWTVDMRGPREFNGRAALEKQKREMPLRQLLGLKLIDAGVLRAHQSVQTAQGEGLTTSGSFAPTLGCSIALARIPAGVAPGDQVKVALRAGLARAEVCKLPFVRQGRVLV